MRAATDRDKPQVVFNRRDQTEDTVSNAFQIRYARVLEDPISKAKLESCLATFP